MNSIEKTTDVLYVLEWGYLRKSEWHWFEERSYPDLAKVKSFASEFSIPSGDKRRIVKVTKTETREVIT